MADYSEVAQKITRTFESQLFSFDLKHQAHFATRMWRISGEEKYCLPIFFNFQLRTLKMAEAISGWKRKSSQKKIEVEMLERWEPSSKRGIQKKEMYQRNPDLYFYTRLIHYLFLLKSFGLEREPLSELYSQNIRYLQKIDLFKLVTQPDFIRFDPSIVVNTVYYLQYLGVANLESKFKPLFLQFWQGEKAKEEDAYKSKIYGFTHLVIAASYFYQRFASADDFSWVLSFFEKNIDEIMKRTNPDIVGEVGLCFKLVKKSSQAEKEAKKHLISKFGPRLGYVPGEGEKGIEKAEHRNIVAILLLSDYSRLYPGPNLRRFMQEKGYRLYLPEKGVFLKSNETN